jgi:CubicO group peptidase (beta-lactamase class C family)
MTQAQLNGNCEERFDPVRDALFGNLRSGTEVGASLAVDIDGETVIDLYGGFRDAALNSPWSHDTIANVWSTTKTITSLAVLMLVERGEVDINAPVGTYWPEFAANGKQDVLVRQVMGHTSGVSGWEQPFAQEDMYDWESSTARLAAQPPWWEPGSASGYHVNNYGHILGEVIRRVTGRTLRRFVEEEIARPLEADFQIGARESDWDRAAQIIAPPPTEFDLEAMGPDSVMVKTFTGPAIDPEAPSTPEWRNADIGAMNGHGNARSIARILSVIALGGEANGVRLLSPKTIDLIFDEQANGTDLVLGIPLRWGVGFGLPQLESVPFVPDGHICFWGGWGGSMIIMDLDRHMTISYVMNKMGPGIIGSQAAGTYCNAIYDCLSS